MTRVLSGLSYSGSSVVRFGISYSGGRTLLNVHDFASSGSTSR